MYRTIVADPPWRYDYKGGPGNASPWRIKTEAHYPLMSLDAIKALPVSTIAAPDAHLYLWVPVPMMEQGYEVVRSWGFTPSTLLTWCKPGPGFGRGWRGNTEHVIVARRKATPFRALGGGTWIAAPRSRHSQKPDVFMDRIEAMSYPPYVELFSRKARGGWAAWGDEATDPITL